MLGFELSEGALEKQQSNVECVQWQEVQSGGYYNNPKRRFYTEMVARMRKYIKSLLCQNSFSHMLVMGSKAVCVFLDDVGKIVVFQNLLHGFSACTHEQVLLRGGEK